MGLGGSINDILELGRLCQVVEEEPGSKNATSGGC